MKNIAIVGGLGYLGSMLYDILSQDQDEYNVTILDNNMYGVCTNPYIYLDVTEENSVNKHFSENKYDVVVNLSAIVGDPACNSNHELAINVNCTGTKHIVNACKQYNMKLVHYSTCSVYGSQFNSVMTEESNAFPIDFYGQLKLFQEKIILEKCPDAIIMRLGTVYGLSKRVRYDLVVNLFIAQAVKDKKITVFGGSQERPFVHGKDVARCVDHLLKSNQSGIFNISGSNYSIKDIAKLVSEHVDCQIEINENIVDKRNYLVSSDKLMNTGYQYTLSIEDAIKEISKSDSVYNYTDDYYSNFKMLNKGKTLQLDVAPKLYEGNVFVDDRGVLSFANSFNQFNKIKRFYQVSNFDKSVVRAFHGHKKEAKFVYVTTGTALVLISKMISDTELDKPIKYILSAKNPKILYIPPNYANGFKPLEDNTNIMFFSTSTLDESKGDDIRYPYDLLGDVWNVENR